MRVAVVADLLRPNGAGLMALTQAQLLSMDHDVMLLTASSPSKLGEEGYSHRTFTSSEAILDKPLSPAHSFRNRRDFRAWLVEQLRGFKADIVMLHNVGRVLDQGQVADLSRTVPVGMTLHDQWFVRDAHYTFTHNGTVRHEFEPDRAPDVAHGYRHLTTVAARSGRLVAIAPSQWIRSEWQQVFPTLPCIHLRNPVDVETFPLIHRSEARARLGIADDAQIVGFVGGPSHVRKGFVRLNAAVRQILGEQVNLILIAVGGHSSSLGDRAMRSIDADSPLRVGEGRSSVPGVDKSIAAHTVVVGGVSRDLIPDIYGAMDVVVHPSVIDNLPTVPIEVGLVGTRCLATAVGGTSESIASPDDLLDPSIDPSGLAMAIRTALNEASNEDMEAREQRRATLVSRFGSETHRPLLSASLRWIAEGLR